MIVQGSLVDVRSAAGRDGIRKGYGFTEEDDVLYALGWPRLVWLEPGDASAKELADSKLFSSRYRWDLRSMPIGAAPRSLRGLMDWRKQNSDSIDAQNDASPIKPKEREAMLDFALTEMLGFGFTLRLEAIFTTPVVLDGLMDRLRKKKAKDWVGAFGATANAAIGAMHWMLLRTEKARASQLREELSAIHKAMSKGTERSRALKALDLAVNGRAGVERSGYVNDKGMLGNDVEYAFDDFDFVRAKALAFIPTMRPADRSWVSGRLAYLGGPDVLEAIAKNVKGVHTSHRDALALDLSLRASDRAGDHGRSRHDDGEALARGARFDIDEEAERQEADREAHEVSASGESGAAPSRLVVFALLRAAQGEWAVVGVIDREGLARPAVGVGVKRRWSSGAGKWG